MNKFHKSTTPALLGSSRPSWVLPCSGQRASIAWGQTHLIFTFRPIFRLRSDPSSFHFRRESFVLHANIVNWPRERRESRYNPMSFGRGWWIWYMLAGKWWRSSIEIKKVESVTSVWSLQLGGEHQHHANIFRRFWASFWQAVTPRLDCVDKYIDRIIQRAITKIEQCTNTGDGSCFFSEIVFSCFHERSTTLLNHLPNIDSRQHHFCWTCLFLQLFDLEKLP